MKFLKREPNIPEGAFALPRPELTGNVLRERLERTNHYRADWDIKPEGMVNGAWPPRFTGGLVRYNGILGPYVQPPVARIFANILDEEPTSYQLVIPKPPTVEDVLERDFAAIRRLGILKERALTRLVKEATVKYEQALDLVIPHAEALEPLLQSYGLNKRESSSPR